MAANTHEVDRKSIIIILFLCLMYDHIDLVLINGMSRDNVSLICGHWIGLLLEYFRSCRPYKLILHRLHEVHGITRR